MSSEAVEPIDPSTTALLIMDYQNSDHPDGPEDGDIVVRKIRVGPFGSTDLHEQLQARGIDTLVLAGISTSGVVLSTVRDAHDRDYRLIVVADLCADRDPEVHEVLIGKVFLGQAEVINAAELHGLLHSTGPGPRPGLAFEREVPTLSRWPRLPSLPPMWRASSARPSCRSSPRRA
jgi:nicotinamidase-related amidase